MKKFLIVAVTLCTTHAMAQNFERRFRMATPFALSDSEIHWVDANNDSLLDVMIVNRVQGEIKIALLKNLGNDSFNLTQTISTGYQTGSFALTDFNQDNKIDFIISGKSLSGIDGTDVFINSGDFSFQRPNNKIKNQAFTEMVFVDLNNDGAKDLVAGDSHALYIYQRIADQFFLKKDTVIDIRSIKSFDFDANGFHDIVFSGTTNGRPTTGLLLFKNRFKILNKISIKAISGNIEAGDLNHDGLFDLIVSGYDSTGLAITQSFQNNMTTFIPKQVMSVLDSVSTKIADFTSDGKTDAAFFRKSNGTSTSWVKTFNGDSISVNAGNVWLQNYGDYDRDGDLDLVQLRSDSIIVFQNNLSETNQGPSAPGVSLAVQLFDRMFFYWEKSMDDHTASNTLTYDLMAYSLGLATSVISAEFDPEKVHRLLVSHGNMGTANYSLQRLSGDLAYKIQSIDNSFTVKTEKGSSCFGAGRCQRCPMTIETSHVTLCSPDAKVQLKPHDPKAMWFSFDKGYLGIHDSLSYSKSEADTIFSFNPSNSLSCANIKLFIITISNSDTVKIAHNLWNCLNSQNTLKVNNEWSSVTWKNNLNSSIGSGNELIITLQGAVVYNAFASNSQGCKLKETFNLKVSKPDLKVNQDQYKIAKGSSVQLNASGGESYTWSPAEGLSNSAIDSPVASPLRTIEYSVTAKDSLGCSSTLTVLVEVMEAGFIPTLFTPNGDGKNDALRIFGLSSASNFRFTIYNREGNVLFDTRDITAATHLGWSGDSNGQAQPTGTYYWKVEGDSSAGQVTLNGKKSGAFLLVR